MELNCGENSYLPNPMFQQAGATLSMLTALLQVADTNTFKSGIYSIAAVVSDSSVHTHLQLT